MSRVLGVIPIVCRTQRTFLLGATYLQHISTLNYSARPSFISRIVTNLKNEFEKNKEMKENIKKFREEAEKLEQSDALKSARKKFNIVESEASKSGEVFKDHLDSLKGKVSTAIDEAAKTELGKRANQWGEEITKSAKGVGDTISETGKKIGQTNAFQSISEASEIVKKEIDTQSIQGKVYKSPVKLRKRKEIDLSSDSRVFEANTEDTGIELHKDSKFYQSWENFKNNNQYVNKVLDWKMKYEESENPMIRASRLLTDKVTDIMGGLFSKTELSETLTEICKVDQNFNEKQFLRDCENDIIPNILEAMVRGDLEILKDWCFESTYNIIATPIAHAQKAGFYLDSKILDIENIDLAMGKVETIITFKLICLNLYTNREYTYLEYIYLGSMKYNQKKCV